MSPRPPLFALLLSTLLFPVHGDDSLEQRVARLRPTERESRWRKIPWRVDLLAARREAELTGKPLFMWLMDGHPLGGT